MTTYTASAAAAGAPVAGHGFAGNHKTRVGSITLSSALAAGDVIEMVRVPKGAVVIGGRLTGGALNTASNVSAVDLDIGFASNTSAFGNLGALSQTAVTGVKPETGYSYPFGGLLLTSGPQTMDREQVIQLYVNTSTAAASFTTATLNLQVDYTLP